MPLRRSPPAFPSAEPGRDALFGCCRFTLSVRRLRDARSGRHRLPAVESLAATLGRLGIDERVQVVAYDASGGVYAARLWWLLRWLGHRRVAVLDGGWQAWCAAGKPSESGPAPAGARRFAAAVGGMAVVTADELWQRLGGNACLLLDARSAERFEGRIEPLDPVAGHVPGATNHPFSANLRPDGRFAAAEELRARFDRLMRGHDPREVISMCGSGVTACHTLLAMEIAGLGGASLYPGSWSEWCRDPSRPVATGPAA